jgi:hypothetical protein
LKCEEGYLPELIEFGDVRAREMASHGFRNQRLALSKNASEQTRNAGSQIGCSSAVVVESLFPNIDGGGAQRPSRTMDALQDEEYTVSQPSIPN